MKSLFIFSLSLFSFSVLSAPEKVIGPDSRVQITSKNAQAFHESVGYLTIRVGNRLGACTATVISPRHAITSAHCLYDKNSYGMVDLASFVPALKTKKSDGNWPHGYLQASKMRILPEYASSLSSKHDMGLLTFKKDLPVKAIPLAVIAKNQTFKIAGYPGDKVDGTLWEASGKRSISFWGYGSTNHEHDVDTEKGQSGSALRVTINGVDKIVGFHAGGNNSSSLNVAYFFH